MNQTNLNQEVTKAVGTEGEPQISDGVVWASELEPQVLAPVLERLKRGDQRLYPPGTLDQIRKVVSQWPQ